jgi:hypothetical protein
LGRNQRSSSKGLARGSVSLFLGGVLKGRVTD